MRRAFRMAVVLVATAVLAALSLPLLIDANQFRPALESRLSRALGHQVTIGDLSLALFSGGIAVRDVTVAAGPGTSLEPLLRARSITAGVDLRELIFSRRLIVHSIAVEEPVIVLVDSTALRARSPSQDAQPAPSGSADRAPLNLAIRQIEISNGRISLSTASSARPIQLQNVNLSLHDFSPDSSFPFTLSAQVASGGDIRFEGRAGPVQIPAPAATPVEGTLTVNNLDLAASGYLEPEAGIGGLLSFNGNVATGGRTIETAGSVMIKQLKLARNGKPAAKPAEAEFRITHDTESRRGSLQDGKVRLGKAEAVAAGSYDVSGPQPAVNLKLAGSQMPLTELAAFLPALDIQLPAGASVERGTADVELLVHGPVSAPVTAASVRVEQARLGNFALSSKMKAVAELAGLPDQSSTDIVLMTANIRHTPDGTTMDGLKFVIPGIGELAGQGTVSPQHALDFRMVARLETSGAVKSLLGENVPFLIQGTSADPSFKPDLKSVASQKLEQAIRNPKGAAQTVRNIIDMFRRAPKQEAEQK